MPALRRDRLTTPAATRLTFEPGTKNGEQPRRGPRLAGKPVQARNGMPERRNYRYRGTGADQCPETAAWD